MSHPAAADGGHSTGGTEPGTEHHAYAHHTAPPCSPAPAPRHNGRTSAGTMLAGMLLLVEGVPGMPQGIANIAEDDGYPGVRPSRSGESGLRQRARPGKSAHSSPRHFSGRHVGGRSFGPAGVGRLTPR
ncbi:hypothetical protein [Streptomyces sp. Wb2n-11]|uniref:hypothetical protein n=1 Tax=Streptomyces sp. Wb2n-11 TaxID=1030533 RepID=UPI000A976B6E|nr:hypothetical protein [Streptomyces sp. Wb2n-11]